MAYLKCNTKFHKRIQNAKAMYKTQHSDVYSKISSCRLQNPIPQKIEYSKFMHKLLTMRISTAMLPRTPHPVRTLSPSARCKLTHQCRHFLQAAVKPLNSKEDLMAKSVSRNCRRVSRRDLKCRVYAQSSKQCWPRFPDIVRLDRHTYTVSSLNPREWHNAANRNHHLVQTASKALNLPTGSMPKMDCEKL